MVSLFFLIGLQHGRESVFSSGFPQVRDGDVSELSQGRDRDGVGAEKQGLWGNEWGLTGLGVLTGDGVLCRETRAD